MPHVNTFAESRFAHHRDHNQEASLANLCGDEDVVEALVTTHQTFFISQTNSHNTSCNAWLCPIEHYGSRHL